jgi:hypothetical protein
MMGCSGFYFHAPTLARNDARETKISLSKRGNGGKAAIEATQQWNRQECIWFCVQ